MMQKALSEIERELGMPADPEPADAAAEADVTPLVALFQARNIRILGTVEDPLFCAFDVAAYIGNTHNYMRIIKKYTPGKHVTVLEMPNANNERRRFSFFTETGLYRYMMQAPGEKAEEFQEFVCELLKAERRKTVDNLKLTIRISQTRIKVLQQNEEQLCVAANDARADSSRMAKELATLRKEKLAAESAAYLMSMGRGHLIDDESEVGDEGDGSDGSDDQTDRGLW